jgi:hypothetical protein
MPLIESLATPLLPVVMLILGRIAVGKSYGGLLKGPPKKPRGDAGNDA